MWTRLVGWIAVASALAPAAAGAVAVDLSTFPGDGTPVPDGTVLADQWRPIGIVFSARTDGGDPIDPIATSFGTDEVHLFFSPDLAGAIAVFDFVEPGTSTPADATYFEIVPFFNAGESAQLVGLDEFGMVVVQDDVVNAEPGNGFMSISGVFRRVEWRTQGDPGIAGKRIEFTLASDARCAPAPVAGCRAAAKAKLLVSEKKTGREKLAAVLARFDAATTQADLGDPVGGATRYDVCVYGSADQGVAELVVDRGGDVCGPKQKPCWKAKRSAGWIYKDPAAASAGVKSIVAVGGAAGKGKLVVKAGNDAKRGATAMPTGVAAALQGATGARVQVLASGAACIEAVLGTVKKADGAQFKATQ